MPTLAELFPELYGTPARTLEQNKPGFVSTLRRTAGQMSAGLGEPLADLGWEENPLRTWGEKTIARNPSGVNSLEDIVDKPGLAIREGAGMALGFFGPQAAARFGGLALQGVGAARAGFGGAAMSGIGQALASPATSVGLASAPSLYGIGQLQEETGEQNDLLKYAGAAAVGGLEMLGGPQRMLFGAGGRALAGVPRQQIGQMASTPLRTLGMQSMRMAGQEAGEELLQNPIEQYAGGENPLETEQLQQTLFGAAMGGIGGLVPFGLASGGRRAMQQQHLNQFMQQNPQDFDTFALQEQFGQITPDQRQNQIAALVRARIAEGLQLGERVNLLQPHDPAAINSTIGEASGALTDPVEASGIPLWAADAQGQAYMPNEALSALDQDVFQALPHEAPAMPLGTEVEPELNRAAAIVQAAMSGGQVLPEDKLWADRILQQSLSKVQLEAFLAGATKPTPAIKPAKMPAQPKPGQPAAAAAPASPFEAAYKEAGGIYSPAQKALAAAKTPEEALAVVRDVLENKTPSQKVMKALEEVHKKLSGQTMTQYLREKEAQEKAAGRVDPKAPGPVTITKGPQNAIPQQQKAAVPAQGQRQGQEAAVPVQKEVAANETLPQVQLPASAGKVPAKVKEAPNVVRQAAPAGVSPQAAGAQPVQEVQAQARAEGARAGGKADPGKAKQVSRFEEPVDAQNFVLQKLAEKVGIRKARLAQLQLGWGGELAAATYDEVAERLQNAGDKTPLTRQRIEQIWKELVREDGPIAQVMAENGINLEDLRPKEVEDDGITQPGDKPRETPKSSLDVKPADVAAAGITDPESEAGDVERNTGFTTGPMSKVNSPNITGEVVTRKGARDPETGETEDTGRIRGAEGDFTYDAEGKANETAERTEKAIEEGDTDGLAIETWNGAVHIDRAQGGKMKSWEQLSETEQGAKTQQAWLALFRESQNIENDTKRNAFQRRRLLAMIKEKYFAGDNTWEEARERFSGLKLVSPAANPTLVRALARRFTDGYGPVLKARFGGVYTYKKVPGFFGDAAVGRMVDDGKYYLFVNRDLWSGATVRMPEFLERMFHHELEHIIDDVAEVFGAYSNDPLLKSNGEVFKEIREQSGRNEWVKAMFKYPMEYTGRFTGPEFVKELYAQIMSAFHTPAFRYKLAQHLPNTSTFAEIIHEKITATVGSRTQAESRPSGQQGAGARVEEPGQGRGQPGAVDPGADGFNRSEGQEASVTYQVVDTQTGRVVGTYKVRGQARAKADKLDLEHGAVRYSVKPVRGEFQNSELGDAPFEKGDVVTFHHPWLKDEETPVTGVIEEVMPDDGQVRVSYMVNGKSLSNIFSVSSLRKNLIDRQGQASTKFFHTVLPFNKAPKLSKVENRFGENDALYKSFPEYAKFIRDLKDKGLYERWSAEKDAIYDALEEGEISVEEMSKRDVGIDEKYGEKLGGYHSLLLARLRKQGMYFSMGLEEAIANYPAELKPSVKTIVDAVKDTVTNWAKKGLQNVVFSSDLSDIAVSEGLPSAKGFFDLINGKAAKRIKMEAELDRIMTKAADLSDRTAVNKFLQNSTRSERWGYKPSWKPDVEVDDVMAASYRALSPEGRAVVDEVFKYGETSYAETQRLVNKEINDEFDRREAAGEDVTEARARQLKAAGRILPKLQGPYAPLKRFGDYVSVAKSEAYLDAEAMGDKDELERLQSDPNHYMVEFHDTIAGAKARSRQLQPFYAKAEGFEKQKAYRDVQEVPWGAIAKVKAHVEDMPETTKHKAAMSRMLNDIYLQMLSEGSARKVEMKRRGVHGEERDMLRSFASQGRASAHFIAALENNGPIQKKISEMQSEARDGGQGTRENRSRVFNEIMARYAQGIDWRPTPLTDKAMRLTSIWMLVTSPAYYLQNATQPFMMTLPVLSGRFGNGAAWASLTKAYKDVGRFVRTFGHNLDIDKLPISDDERAMLRQMRDSGRIDLTIAQDLGRWTAGETAVGRLAGAVAPKTKSVFDTVMRTINNLPHQVEMLNRITSALAAYRLSKGNAEYAARIVDQTHGNYAASNAPRFMHANAAARLITQFRKFQLIQVSLLARLAKDAFKGATPEERRVARAALTFVLAHHMVMAGALGLPLMNIIGPVLAHAFGDDDEPKDFERMVRKAIGDEDVANLLLRGVPAALGVDVSGRVGMGNAFALLPFTDIDLTSKKGLATTALGAMGPFVGGLLPNVAEGIGTILQGDYYKGLELLAPRGLRDAMRANRFATEGVTKKNNDVALKPSEVSMLDVMTQAVGLPSTELQARQRRIGDVVESEEYYKDRTGKIKHQYAKAYRENDVEDMRDLREEWASVAAAMRRNGLKPQPMSNLLKAPQEQRKRERETIGGVPVKKSNREFVRQGANL